MDGLWWSTKNYQLIKISSHTKKLWKLRRQWKYPIVAMGSQTSPVLPFKIGMQPIRTRLLLVLQLHKKKWHCITNGMKKYIDFWEIWMQRELANAWVVAMLASHSPQDENASSHTTSHLDGRVLAYFRLVHKPSERWYPLSGPRCI